MKTREEVEAGYRDDSYLERNCDCCGKPYRGPAVYCSLECAVNDAQEVPLPSHCGQCGVLLQGGATEHKPECPWYPISYKGIMERKAQ